MSRSKDGKQNGLQVLFVTTQWPTTANPNHVPFVVRQVEYLRKAGVNVEVFFCKGHWNPINFLKAALELRRHVARFDYDVIHARFAQAGLVALAQRKVPVVVTYGGTDVLGRKDQEGRLTLKGYAQRLIALFVSRLVSANIVVSRHLAEVLGMPDSYVIPAGIDLSLFQPIDRREARKRVGVSGTGKIILFVGNPEKVWNHKRHDLASKVVTCVQASLPDVEMVTVFNRPHDEIPLWMNAANVLLVTSRQEGSPNVVKEALACNLPIVSVDVGDVRDRLESIEGCFVCEGDSVEELAAGVIHVLSHYDHVQGRSAVEALDESRLAQKTLRVYEEVVYERRG